MHTAFINIDPDRLLNETEVSDITGLSVRTLQAWRIQGRGPLFCKLGRAVRYRRKDLQTWMDTQTSQSTTQADAKAALP